MNIFAVITEINSSTDTIFGNITQFCHELSYLSTNANCLFYVTSLQLFLTPNPQGYQLVDEKWILTDVPYPTIIHNRIHVRKVEQSIQFQHFMNVSDTLHIPIFNDHFIHKWEVYKLLSRKKSLQPYIPYTEQLKNKNQLATFLEKYKQIYLKPIQGSQGRLIFRIEYNNEYLLLSSTDNSNYTFQNIDSLYQYMKDKMKKISFIIQQGIPLLNYQQQPIDFRVLTHKTSLGKWIVTSNVARISATDQFVSNIARGGTLRNTNEILEIFFHESQLLHVKKLMHEFSTEISRLLDSSIYGLYGEFGIDLALDNDGNLWLIEVNTKPSKKFDDTIQIHPSSKAIFHYFQLLSNKE